MAKTLPTLKAAKAAHPLASVVLRQLGGGVEAVQSAIDAATHGADAGFHGFIYYHEIARFVARHRRRIAAVVKDVAAQLDESPIALVRGFCGLDKPSDEVIAAVLFGGSLAADNTYRLHRVMQVESVLAWFVLEEVGRALVDLD